MQHSAIMQRGMLLSSLLLIFAGLPATPVTAEPVQQVVLGTSTHGGGFALFGEQLAAAIKAGNAGVTIETLASKGSAQNLTWLQEGRIDIGLVEGNAAHEVLVGVTHKPDKLQVLSVMYPNPGMFVVRADSAYRRIEDLLGKPVAFGTRASGLRLLAQHVLDGVGLDPAHDFQQVILDKAADGPQLLLDNKVDALWGAGIGWPGFVQVAESPVGARFIAPSPAQIEQILLKHPYLKPMSVPAGTYQGQAQRIDSVGLWSLIMTRADLPEATAYQLARALHQAEGALAGRLEQGSYTTAANTLAQVPVQQLHPGVVRYYREAGLLQ